jgi:hypothetical protein
MIKLKELIKEHAWKRKFGEPLPTLESSTEKHKVNINEKSGLTDDVKKFRTEYDVKHGKLKEKALKLHERQQIMKAVSMVNDTIMKMIGELNKLPVTDALENVKKSHANKYIRAIETLKGICEQNAGWLKENK